MNKRSLFELAAGDSAVLDAMALPDNLAGHLLDLGFVPGSQVTVVRCGPAGGPRVYRVDGTDVALRRDVAERITVLQPMAEC